MTDYKIPADAGSNSHDWAYDDWTIGGPNDSNVTYAFDDVAPGYFSTKVTNSSGSDQGYRIEYISPKIDLSDASDKACILRIKSGQRDRGTVSPFLSVSFSSATSGWKKLFNWTYQSSTGGDDGDEFEMNYSSKDKVITIDEIYSIGPSISILMEGYVQSNELISLRGTLVPATTINRTIASIPLIGDILIGKKVGEGVFGVSFKIKGPPKALKTVVNPIKTLTPRFITRTLEKLKKN